jgi:excisionase family DNA binding protein
MLDPASRLEVPLVSDPWISADDIAVHLGVTKDTVYAWIADKGMPAHKVGRLWRFQASEVDEWVRSGSGALSGENSSAPDSA